MKDSIFGKPVEKLAYKLLSRQAGATTDERLNSGVMLETFHTNP